MEKKPITTLDGPKEEQRRIVEEFLGIRSEQSPQDSDVDDDSAEKAE